jgi:hypothetical protein
LGWQLSEFGACLRFLHSRQLLDVLCWGRAQRMAAALAGEVARGCLCCRAFRDDCPPTKIRRHALAQMCMGAGRPMPPGPAARLRSGKSHSECWLAGSAMPPSARCTLVGSGPRRCQCRAQTGPAPGRAAAGGATMADGGRKCHTSRLSSIPGWPVSVLVFFGSRARTFHPRLAGMCQRTKLVTQKCSG